ncbi:MAG TPA: 30S ribosomal protein S1 [Anaerovoracaceae bacterium]|nr:30S ribosomal protein S1 [Anaerovoracaceae bacterium]
MEEKTTMQDFMDEIEQSMKRIYKDDVLEGTIISAGEEEILVNINYTSDGIITKEEMSEGYDYQVGGRISVLVLDPHDSEGNVILSHRQAEAIVGWDDLEEAFEEKKKVHVKVMEAVKGGVSAEYRSVRCFIPASLLSYRYVEDMGTYAGKTLEVTVEDFDRENKRVVLSRKSVETAERQGKKEKLMDQLQVGEMRQGTVTKLMKFGAFVDLGGVEGLIYLDDLAWHRVNHPSEVVSEGDPVTVYVSNIDKKNGKIGLVLKKVEEDPWQGAADYYKPDDLVEGTVVRLVDFGAFVEVEAGIEGLVHLSEISSERIRKPSDVLKVGDKVQAVILSVDEKNKKLSLSIKEAEGQTADGVELVREEKGATLGDLFGDKFKDFFQK